MSQHWPTPPIPAAKPPADEPVAATHEPVAATPDSFVSPAPQRDERPWWRRSLSLLVVIGLLALKWGKAVLLLAPKAKLLTTSGTMLVSIAAYSLIWGWKFALGFVLLLLVHEMGHVIQLRREGIEASAPMFIPFLGAAVMAKSLGDDATAEARVGLAGPVLGTLGALALLPIAITTGDHFWYALVFTGLFLNLFNLLPVLPLDGGRAMAALTPWMWLVGFAMLIAVAFAFPNPIMLIILLFGGLETWRRWKARKTDEGKRYHEVRPRHRVAVAVTYVGLAVACAVGMDLTFVARDLSSF